MSSLWVVVVGVVLLLAVTAIAKLVGERSGSASGYKGEALLTENEKEFYQRLKRALPDHEIFPQVAMGAVLAPSVDRSSRRYHQIRGTFSQKIIDFVICDASLKVVAVVELDDRTHNAARDEKRDAMLNCANYRVLRWRSKKKPSEDEIRARVVGPKPQPAAASPLPPPVVPVVDHGKSV